VAKSNSSLWKYYARYHNLVDRYGLWFHRRPWSQWTKEKDNRRRNRQHNGQKKRTTEVPQKTTLKPNDWIYESHINHCNACPSYYPFGIFNLFYYSNINISANEVAPMVLEVKTNEIF
jgi:hypothetical protein